MRPGQPQFTENATPVNMKKSIINIIKISKPYWFFIGIAILSSFISVIFTLMGPDKLKEITNLITAGLGSTLDLDGIISICLFLVAIYSASAFLGFFQGFTMATITQKISQNLRTKLSEKINKLPLRYFDSTTHGDTLSRVTNDIDSMGQALQQSVSQLVSAVVMFIGSLILMFYNNWIMALTAVISTILGFTFMMIIMKASQKHFVANQRNLGAINGHVEEIYSGHNIVKAYNGEYAAIKRFEEMNEALYESNWKSQFFSGLMQPLMGFIGNLGYVAVCVVGAVLALNGHISFGVIVAFMTYIRLFTQPLTQIAQVMTSMQTALAASERVFELLDEVELSDESHIVTALEKANGEVCFEHVKFSYVEDKEIIHDFSAKILPGQKVAIVGPTGAGKTTMVNLLMRFYEINDGKITIDGVDTKSLSRENIHKLFGMVLQDTWLFEGTIEDNIRYGQENISLEDVIKACKAVGLDHFIKTLPQGYQTVLDDKASVSSGQKQLITIARAMIENAPLLILDEATSSVDTRTEALVQEAMNKLTQNRTSFVIAHRLSTIKNADLILAMKDGDIIESGTHKSLLASGGFYADLYNSQFEEMAAS